MIDWQHGYVTDMPYTYGFYRESVGRVEGHETRQRLLSCLLPPRTFPPLAAA